MNDFIVEENEIEIEKPNTISENQIVFEWLLGQYLPEILDRPFQIVIALFLKQPIEFRDKIIFEHPEFTVDEIKSELDKQIESYLRNEFQMKLIELVKT